MSHPNTQDTVDQGCRPLCALCAWPLSSSQLITAPADFPWYPAIREKLLNNLTQTRSPYRDLPGPDQLAEEHSVALEMFDPNIVTPENTQWLNQRRALTSMMVKEVKGKDDLGNRIEVFKMKFFKLGSPRIYSEPDWLYPTIRIGHDNNMGLDHHYMLNCYKMPPGQDTTGTFGPEPAMPHHAQCIKLFMKFMSSEFGLDRVSFGVLYMSMLTRTQPGHNGHYLDDLEYLAEGYENNGWPWQCRPGFEYLVLDPLGPSSYIRNVLHRKRTALGKSAFLHSNPQTISFDIFSRLPNELKLMVVENLRPTDAYSLTTASRVMLLGTNRPKFWKRYALRQLPWLFELGPIARKDKHCRFDYRVFSNWMDKISELNDPKRTDRYLFLVNRRRLWESWHGLGHTVNEITKHSDLSGAEVGSLEWMSNVLEGLDENDENDENKEVQEA